MAAVALALAFAFAAAPLDAAVQTALEAALALPGARVELVELGAASPRGCAAESAEAKQRIAASGRVALRLSGRDGAGGACEAWAWARVRVKAPALAASRAIAEGEPLTGAVAASEREVLPGREPLGALPEGAVAVRALAAGTALDASDLRIGPRPGEPVRVVLRAGSLEISQEGRAIPCRRGRACAVLPSGRRVEGVVSAGRLVLEGP